MTIKQVIVMRTDLGMRKGKMIAQGAHASIAFLADNVEPYDQCGDGYLRLRQIEWDWLGGLFTKICVRADSEDQLLGITENAQKANLRVSLIQDAGLTEFGGIPTYTCCAIGPDTSERIDPITGGLTLL